MRIVMAGGQVADIKRGLHFGAGADQQDTGSAAVCIGEDLPADGPPRSAGT